MAALTLLNDPIFVEAARVFAERILSEQSGSFDERLDFAFRLAVSRVPDAKERQLLKKLYDSGLAKFSSDPDAAKLLINVGQAEHGEGLSPDEVATWMTIARAILNLSETISRN